MLKEYTGDILKSGATYICHQVNCRGAMNSGLAKHIKNKYPKVYDEYKARVNKAKSEDSHLDDFGLLGRVLAVDVEDCTILNCFSQNYYGKDGKRYTDYVALQVCLNSIYSHLMPNERVAFPYRFGCGLGGGNWEVVKKMIAETFNDKEVEIWRLE